MSQRPYVKNAADEKQVKEGNAKSRIGRQLELNDVRTVLGTSDGRRFMWRYLRRCGIFSSSFVAGDSHQTAFLEGERRVGLELLADVNDADPGAYLKMMHENQEGEDNG